MSTFLSTANSSMIDLLPTEILWKIMQSLEPVDLSITRLVCRKLCAFSDHPKLWKDIQLAPSQNNSNETLPLWCLKDLKAILHLHREHIQTIQIWGVRDNNIQYILLNCNNLQELTISGWSTLSDHAFRIPFPQPAFALNLRRLRLIGQRKSNYTSLDAVTFGKLLKTCPYLEEITVVSCQIHVQAESLLQMVEQDVISNESETILTPQRQQHQHQHQQQENDRDHHPTLSSLKTLVVATKRTWSSQHVMRLFQLCTNLQFLGLVPDSIEIVDYTGLNVGNNDEIKTPMPILDVSAPPATSANSQPPHLLTKNIHAIEDHEVLESDNLIVYKINKVL